MTASASPVRKRGAQAGAAAAETSAAPSAGDDGVLLPDAGDAATTPPSFVFRYLLHEDAEVGKLFSREDPLNLHKTLGLLAIASFTYRYGFVFQARGDLGFDGTIFDWVTMGLHLALSLSSVIFHVPAKRIAKKPMMSECARPRRGIRHSHPTTHHKSSALPRT